MPEFQFKKYFKIVVLAFGALTLMSSKASAAAIAGLFLEPMVTYEGHSETKLDWPAPFKQSTGSVEGLGLGARIGFHINDMFFVAADARYSKPKFKDSSNNVDVESDSYNYGVVAGLQTPYAGLRLWGTYVFGAELNPKEGQGVDVKFSDAKGYRIGAGFHFAMFSLNLEYQDLKYEKLTLENGVLFAGSTVNYDLTNKSYILSVGFPFELL